MRKGFMTTGQFLTWLFLAFVAGAAAALYLQYSGVIPPLTAGSGGGQETQAGIGLLAFTLRNSR